MTEYSAARRTTRLQYFIVVAIVLVSVAWLAWLHLSAFGLFHRDILKTYGGQVWRITPRYGERYDPKTKTLLPRQLADYIHPDTSKVIYEAQLESEHQKGSMVVTTVGSLEKLGDQHLYFLRVERENKEHPKEVSLP